MQRWIIHVDMDAFYAAVEQRDDPTLKGQPVIIGGNSLRGVVSTASYEARVFGVRSAMPIVQAKRLCPHGVFLAPDHHKYETVSAQIQHILNEFSPLVEPLSLDEAFLDVTGMELMEEDPVAIARSIKERIRGEVGLTASAGVAPNKFLAKLASDLGKPDGLYTIQPGEEASAIAHLPVKRLWGVGEATASVLHRLGIQTIGQMAVANPHMLEAQLGKAAYELHRLAQGRDDRPVVPNMEPKSVGKEITFERDLSCRQQMEAYLLALSEKVGWRLRLAKLAGRTVTLKLRFASFRTLTRSHTLAEPLDDDETIYTICRELLKMTALPEGVRLLGVTVSHFGSKAGQTSLFEETSAAKRSAVYPAIDQLKLRFGENVIRRGGLLAKQDIDD